MMNAEKKIDIEKHCAIIDIKNTLCSMPCDICSMEGKGCINEHIASRLANAGFRRASKVALEVIGEVEKIISKEMLRCDAIRPKSEDFGEMKFWEGGEYSLRQSAYWIAELKKKYTEGER